MRFDCVSYGVLIYRVGLGAASGSRLPESRAPKPTIYVTLEDLLL